MSGLGDFLLVATVGVPNRVVPFGNRTRASGWRSGMVGVWQMEIEYNH